MKKKKTFLMLFIILLIMSTINVTPAFAGTEDVFNGVEILNLPDRLALTDEPITISSVQYAYSDGIPEESTLRYYNFVSPKDSNVIEVTLDTEIDPYFPSDKPRINSVTITPKGVGYATICFGSVFNYYKTIYVYDPDMPTAERDTPSNLKVQKITPKELLVSWDPVYGATEYNVYRSKTGKDGTFKKVKTTTEAFCVDKGLTSGKTYYYKVKARTQDGISNASKVVKCRVAYKLKISVKMRNKAGRSTSYIKVPITNKGSGTFTIKHSTFYYYGKVRGSSALYYPYSKASYTQAILVNGTNSDMGDGEVLSELKIKKGKSRVATYKLETPRIPQNTESICFEATYDGVKYFIVCYHDGTIFYMYNGSKDGISYKDSKTYQLK